MAFPVDDILLGPAAFGGLHRLDGAICHTGEEPGVERRYAVATATWQLTHPGSYNFRIYDRRSDPRGVMLNVPWRMASGGINPSSTAWAPDRHPFLERELAKAGPCPRAGCPGAYRNPTMHHLQLSFVGKTAQLQAAAEPPNYVDDALALIAWMGDHPDRGPAPLVVSNHGQWQSNRSDAGTRMYGLLVIDGDVPMLTPRMFVPQPWTARAGTPVRQWPADDAPVIATLAGGACVTIEEEAELRDGTRVTTGPWRTVVLGDWRTGYVHRLDLTVMETGRAAYLDFIRTVLFGVDPADVPDWPLAAGVPEAEVAQRVYQAADATARAARRTADNYRPS